MLLKLPSAALEFHSCFLKNQVHMMQMIYFLAFLLTEKSSFLALVFTQHFLPFQVLFSSFLQQKTWSDRFCRNVFPQQALAIQTVFLCAQTNYMLEQVVVHYEKRNPELTYVLKSFCTNVKTTASGQGIDIIFYYSFATFGVSLESLP